MEPTETKSNGALVGVAIIILILVIGGIYFWIVNSKIENPEETQELNTTNIIINEEGQSSNSDVYKELDNLDKEFESTDVEAGVDVEAIQ